MKMLWDDKTVQITIGRMGCTSENAKHLVINEKLGGEFWLKFVFGIDAKTIVVSMFFVIAEYIALQYEVTRRFYCLFWSSIQSQQVKKHFFQKHSLDINRFLQVKTIVSSSD